MPTAPALRPALYEHPPGSLKLLAWGKPPRLARFRISQTEELFAVSQKPSFGGRCEADAVIIHHLASKGALMKVVEEVSSGGRVTIPEDIRNALGISEGDRVAFELKQKYVLLMRSPDLTEMSGSVEVPDERQGLSWEEVRNIARQERAKAWR